MYTEKALEVIDEVKRAVVGKEECITKMMIAVLAGGHVLIEDIPGVGKTTLALAFSRAMNLQQHRVQFTPDVLPADITGFHIYRKETNEMIYQPGAILCNIFLADEINRTSPKTQSALLEVMEEGSVTVDASTMPVPDPFLVIATQNPTGSAGTQPLPESQLDRFMISMSMGYPDIEEEIRIVKERNGRNPLDDIIPAVDGAIVAQMKAETEQVYIHDLVYTYIGQIVQATRSHPLIELGGSPRATLAISGMAKGRAYLEGRNYAIPRDVRFVAEDVLKHRIRLNGKARADKRTPEQVIADIIATIAEPTPKKKK